MENILLTFIICLILAGAIGINIVIRILRSIPFMGAGAYGPPMLAAGGAPREPTERRGGISFTLILLIITALSFWFMIIHEYDLEKESYMPSPQKEESISEELVPDIDYYRPKTKPPDRSIEQSENQSSDIRQINYNQKPTADEPPANTAHYLQLNAFVTKEKAFKYWHEFRTAYENVHIVRHKGQYKVVIGPFPDEVSVTTFKKRHRLRGYEVTY